MPLCEACRGSGWVVTEKDGFSYASPCPECRRRRRRESRWERAQIPPRYLDRGFDAYSIHDPSQETALRRAVEFVEAYPRVDRGLLFVGSCGVGKTHLAVSIMKALVDEKEVEARFVDEAELLRRLQYSYTPGASSTEREVLLPLMDVELLVWDDLGTGRPTDWVRETIRMVINHRYTNRRLTLMTTNWPLQAGAPVSSAAGGVTLEERIGVRLYSRILEMCEVVEVKGPDARRVIHKAALDFQQQKRSQKSVLDGRLQCPKCGASSVDVLGQAEARRTGSLGVLEISGLCRNCYEHFLCRYDPGTGKVDYPEHPL